MTAMLLEHRNAVDAIVRQCQAESMNQGVAINLHSPEFGDYAWAYGDGKPTPAGAAGHQRPHAHRIDLQVAAWSAHAARDRPGHAHPRRHPIATGHARHQTVPFRVRRPAWRPDHHPRPDDDALGCVRLPRRQPQDGYGIQPGDQLHRADRPAQEDQGQHHSYPAEH